MPELSTLTTDAREAELSPGTEFTARLEATDPDGDPLVLGAGNSAPKAQTGGKAATARPSPQRHPECFVEAKGLVPPSAHEAAPAPTGYLPTSMTVGAEQPAPTSPSP